MHERAINWRHDLSMGQIVTPTANARTVKTFMETTVQVSRGEISHHINELLLNPRSLSLEQLASQRRRRRITYLRSSPLPFVISWTSCIYIRTNFGTNHKTLSHWGLLKVMSGVGGWGTCYSYSIGTHRICFFASFSSFSVRIHSLFWF